MEDKQKVALCVERKAMGCVEIYDDNMGHLLTTVTDFEAAKHWCDHHDYKYKQWQKSAR